jgi:spermidine/putrescine-binding protein
VRPCRRRAARAARSLNEPLSSCNRRRHAAYDERRGLLERFEAETGIKVNYDTFGSSEMLETKLLTGSSGYDVVVPSTPFLQRQAASGVYQPIDRTRLPHYGNLDPEMMAMVAVSDPGNTYGVGYMWGTTGIAYDARKVAAAVPDAPTDSWRLVFDPAVASKLAGCGIAVRAQLRLTQPRTQEQTRIENRIWTRFRTGQ